MRVPSTSDSPTPSPTLQPGSAYITTNGSSTYYPSTGYDGFSSFTASINVPSRDTQYTTIYIVVQEQGLYIAGTLDDSYSFTTKSGQGSVTIPAYSALFYLSYFNTFQGQSLAFLYAFINPDPTTKSITINDGIQYIVLPQASIHAEPDTTATFALYAAIDGDILNYGSFGGLNTNTGLYQTYLIVDEEDMDIFR